MNILAIDTSNLALGVALTDGDKVLAEHTTNVRKNHSVRLMPTVTRLLEEVQLIPEELDGIVVARGPGSYTGVRIGVTAAKTLAWALQIPLVGISSLEVIASNASYFTGLISPLFDARRGQVYTGLYRGNGSEVMPVEQERIILIDDWLERISSLQEPIIFLGDDTKLFREKLTSRLRESALFAVPEYNVPRAAYAARLGWKRIMAGDVDQVDSFAPAYLQLTEAEAKWLAKQEKETQCPVFRSMNVNDLTAIFEIESLSFTIPWSVNAFYNELTQNQFARYIVAELDGRVVGYAGMWLIMDEAHITNIAVHPDYRGQKLGEKLLRRLMEEARSQRMKRMTLEVRRSNEVAQNLYKKMGFYAAGFRPRYYTDNDEDAMIMWVVLNDADH